jgi:adenylate cyclase
VSDAGSAADWLIDGARDAPTPESVLSGLCRRLLADGVPLERANVFVRTLHPSIMGRRFFWRRDAEGVAVSEPSFEFLETDEYRQSTVAVVTTTGWELRRRLVGPDCADDFPVLQALRDEGVTDYLISPLSFSNGEIHAASWTTDAPGGFTDEALARLRAVAAPLARVAEIRALRRTAGTLLDTYVGRNAGTRILAGQIRRGDTEAISAVIWLSDLRDFTLMADRMPAGELIALLNRCFDCQVPAILAHGGEVLKFMGDGLLAIFPIAAAEAAAGTCDAALAAAREARALLADLATPTGTPVRFGLALHVGEVLYGNIGGGNRLDFTCIGPAVNLAARLEKLARDLGRSVVVSSAFAAHRAAGLRPLGDHALRGVGQPQPAFGLIEEE